MTKDEIRSWMDRWRLVNEYEREELRKTPIETRFRQLANLMHTARTIGWTTSTPAEIDAVRARWLLLKRDYCDAR